MLFSFFLFPKSQFRIAEYILAVGTRSLTFLSVRLRRVDLEFYFGKKMLLQLASGNCLNEWNKKEALILGNIISEVTNQCPSNNKVKLVGS